MTSETLMPCPFCGGEPDWKRWEVNGVWQIKIFCDTANCHVHPSVFGNEKTMTVVWNTRQPPVPVIDGLDEAITAMNTQGDEGIKLYKAFMEKYKRTPEGVSDEAARAYQALTNGRERE